MNSIQKELIISSLTASNNDAINGRELIPSHVGNLGELEIIE